MNPNKGLSLGFEFLDIEIIDHKKEPKLSNGKWNCDECSLFFLSQDKLAEHKNKHSAAAGEAFKCRYCNKVLSIKEESKESFANRKCSTCEYKCSKCPLRFQRHSSFVNHEKSHLLLKKKKSISLKKKQSRPETKKITGINISRKQKAGKIATEKQKIIKRKGNSDEHITETISPKKRKTLPGMPQNEKFESIDTNNKSQTNDKKTKPCITTNSKTSEENTNQSNDNKTKQCVTTNIKTSEDKSVGEKQNNKTNAPTDSVNNSSHDSIVNYKPFSCHICGDNFASGDSLIAHIQTHGENVSKGFKCKHCGDEFDDIYKMQYHLAICPLAEDETINVKNIPPKFHITPTNGLPRKKGRPKKIKQDNSDKDSDNDQTPSFSRRKSVKTRKKVDKTSESATETTNILCNSSSKYSTRLRRSKADKTEETRYSLTNEFVDINSHYMKNHSDIMEDDPLEVKENINDPFNDSFETVEDDKAKVHSCPFPRCGIKFSREKALLCHMRNHNDDFEDSYKCHKCDIPFDDIQSLRSHLNECKDVKEENEESVSEPEYTDNYISTDKSFQKKRGALTCNICGRTYLSQEQMKRHLALHGSSNFICRICKDMFINQSLLDEHFIAKHPQKSSYHCEICNEDFISELFLNIHESEYHGEPTPEQSTYLIKDDNLDGNESSKTSSMTLKVLKSHSYCSTVANSRCTFRDKKQFWCPVCFKHFDQKESLRLHFRTDHIPSVGSVYVCEVCESEKPNAEMLCFHLEMHSSNVLSVNRFSTLRACVSGREIKSHQIVPNKSKSKISSQKQDFDEEYLIPSNKTVQSNLNSTGRKYKLVKKTARQKLITKVKKGLKRTVQKQPREVLLRKFDSKTTTSKKLYSNKCSQPKNVRNSGNCELDFDTHPKTSKINNSNKRLTERKRRGLDRNVKNNKRTYDSVKRALSPEHVETSECVDGKESTGASSDENSVQGNVDESTNETVIDDSNNIYTLSANDNNCNKNSNITKNKDSNISDGISSVDAKNTTDDTCGEEICCSMCSMVFYHQDELLDHVATHI